MKEDKQAGGCHGTNVGRALVLVLPGGDPCVFLSAPCTERPLGSRLSESAWPSVMELS